MSRQQLCGQQKCTASTRADLFKTACLEKTDTPTANRFSKKEEGEKEAGQITGSKNTSPFIYLLCNVSDEALKQQSRHQTEGSERHRRFLTSLLSKNTKWQFLFAVIFLPYPQFHTWIPGWLQFSHKPVQISFSTHCRLKSHTDTNTSHERSGRIINT